MNENNFSNSNIENDYSSSYYHRYINLEERNPNYFKNSSFGNLFSDIYGNDSSIASMNLFSSMEKNEEEENSVEPNYLFENDDDEKNFGGKHFSSIHSDTSMEKKKEEIDKTNEDKKEENEMLKSKSKGGINLTTYGDNYLEENQSQFFSHPHSIEQIKEKPENEEKINNNHRNMFLVTKFGYDKKKQIARCEHPGCDKTFRTMRIKVYEHDKRIKICRTDTIILLKLINHSRKILKKINRKKKEKIKEYDNIIRQYVNKIQHKSYATHILELNLS